MKSEKKKRLVKNEDYVEFYASSLKENNEFFKQHKILIDSQILASRQIFRNKFNTENFEEEARDYLRKIGLLA